MIRSISLNPSQTKISGYSSGDTVLIKCDVTNEAFSVYLPDATVANASFLIIKTDSSTNAVTVYPYSSQTVDDADSLTISSQYDCHFLVPDGSNYKSTKHHQAESTIDFTDITTGNASTTVHGYAPKAVAPSAGTLNYLGINNGETVYACKSASSNPGAAAAVLQTTTAGLLTLQNLTIASFGTAGIVHNSAAGVLTSSLIVAADITNNTITNTQLANLGTAGTIPKFGATGFADSLLKESAHVLTYVGDDIIINYTDTTLYRFHLSHPTWPTVWQNGIEFDWAAVPRITNVYSYSDVSDGLITLNVGTRAVPKIGMMVRGGAGGSVLYDGNIGFGTTTIAQMQDAMITVRRSGNGPTAGSGWPKIQFYNPLVTKGDGATTFNFAGCTFYSGDATVGGYFFTSYDDVFSGMSFGTSTAHPINIVTGGTTKVSVTSGGNVSLVTDGVVTSYGVNGEVTLTHVHNTGLLLNTTMALQFRDAALYISSKNDGYLDFDADTAFRFNTGNVGIGVTPQAWTTNSVLQIGSYGALFSTTATGTGKSTILSHNYFFDGADKNIVSDPCVVYRMVSGINIWYSAVASGPGAITLVEKMRLNLAGYLGLGNDTPLMRADINGSAGYAAVSGTAPTGALRLGGATGTAVVDFGIDSAVSGNAWIQVTSKTDLSLFYNLILQPNGGSAGIGMVPTYTLDVTGNFRCSTGFGCNSKTPQTAYTVNVASTDLPTVVALCNQLRAALVANGICV